MRQHNGHQPPAQRLALTIEEAAEALGISVREIYRMLARRQLVSITFGRRRLLPMRELERVINEQLAAAGIGEDEGGGGGHAA